MSTNYLLDTSVLIPSLKEHQEIRHRMTQATSLYVSTIALGELYYGAEHSGDPDYIKMSLTQVEAIEQSMIIVVVDGTTARIYGQMKHLQQAKGFTTPDNDLWIAAVAIQHNLTLAARDRHFTRIDKLLLELW